MCLWYVMHSVPLNRVLSVFKSEMSITLRISELISYFSVFSGRISFQFVEKSAEIKLIIISDNLGNLIDRIRCCFKQHLSIGNTDSHNELHWRGASVFFKISDKPADTHSSRGSIIVNINIFILVFIEKGNSVIHLMVKIFIFQDVFSGQFPMEANQKMTQQKTSDYRSTCVKEMLS